MSLKPNQINFSGSDSFQYDSKNGSSGLKTKRKKKSKKSSELNMDSETNPKPRRRSASLTRNKNKNSTENMKLNSNDSNSKQSNFLPNSEKRKSKRSKSQTSRNSSSLINEENLKLIQNNNRNVNLTEKQNNKFDNSKNNDINKSKPKRSRRSGSVSSRKSNSSNHSRRSSSVTRRNDNSKKQSNKLTLYDNKNTNDHNSNRNILNDDLNSMNSNSSFHFILQPLQTTETYENTEYIESVGQVDLSENSNDSSYTYISIASSAEKNLDGFQIKPNNMSKVEDKNADKSLSQNSQTMSSEYTYVYLEDDFNPSSSYSYAYISLDTDKFRNRANINSESSYTYIELPSSSSNAIPNNADLNPRNVQTSNSSSQSLCKKNGFTIEKQEPIVIDSAIQQMPRRKNARRAKNSMSRRKQNVLRRINLLEAQLDELQSTTSVMNNESTTDTEDPIINDLQQKLAHATGKTFVNGKKMISPKDKEYSSTYLYESELRNSNHKPRNRKNHNKSEENSYVYSTERSSQNENESNMNCSTNNSSATNSEQTSINYSYAIDSSKLMNSDVNDHPNKEHHKSKKKVKKVVPIHRFKSENQQAISKDMNGSQLDSENKNINNLNVNKDEKVVETPNEKSHEANMLDKPDIMEISPNEKGVDLENTTEKSEKKMKKILRRIKVEKNHNKASSPTISTVKSSSASRRNHSLPRKILKNDFMPSKLQSKENLPSDKNDMKTKEHDASESDIDLIKSVDYVKVSLIEDSNLPMVQRYCVLYIEGQEKNVKQTHLISGDNHTKYNEIFEYCIPKSGDQASKLHILIKKQDLIRGDKILGAIKINLNSLPINEIINKWIPITTGAGLITTSKLHVIIQRMAKNDSKPNQSFNLDNSYNESFDSNEDKQHSDNLPDIRPRNFEIPVKSNDNNILKLDENLIRTDQNEETKDDIEHGELSSLETLSEDEDSISKKIDRRFGVLKSSHKFEFNQKGKTIYNLTELVKEQAHSSNADDDIDQKRYKSQKAKRHIQKLGAISSQSGVRTIKRYIKDSSNDE